MSDSVEHEGALIYYLTFGEWKWKYVKKSREGVFDIVYYGGRRKMSEVGRDAVFVSIPHGDVLRWRDKLDRLLPHVQEILRRIHYYRKVALVCDESAKRCLFWRTLKLVVRTAKALEEYPELPRLLGCDKEDMSVICGLCSREGCKHRFYCPSKSWIYRCRFSIVIPLRLCVHHFAGPTYRRVLENWEECLDSGGLDEVAAEVICDV
jgi:hypothetical protein